MRGWGELGRCTGLELQGTLRQAGLVAAHSPGLVATRSPCLTLCQRCSLRWPSLTPTPLRTHAAAAARAARKALAERKGEGATRPWNIGYALAGEVEKEMDPYLPFSDAVDV